MRILVLIVQIAGVRMVYCKVTRIIHCVIINIDKFM